MRKRLRELRDSEIFMFYAKYIVILIVISLLIGIGVIWVDSHTEKDQEKNKHTISKSYKKIIEENEEE